MKTKLFLLFLVFFLLSAGQAFGTISVSGSLQDLTGTAVTSGSFVRFYMRGCNGNQPFVSGVALIAPTSGAIWFKDFLPNGSGAISGTLYATGDVNCGGSTGVIWYGMVIFVNGKAGPESAIDASRNINISAPNFITSAPVVPAPSGDTIYARLDGTNMPFTGAIRGPSMSLNGSNALNSVSGNSGRVVQGAGTYNNGHVLSIDVNANAVDSAFAVANLASIANPLSQFASTTSAQLRGVLSDPTGTGSAVFATSPTLVTPALGTPSAATLTNATGLPASGLVPGSNGQCVITSASASTWGSCAGTAGVQTIGTPNNTAVTANANTSAVQALMSGNAFGAGVLNSVGKTFRLTAEGTVIAVNTTEVITLWLQFNATNQIGLQFNAQTASLLVAWKADALCSVQTTGSSGNLECHMEMRIAGGAGSTGDTNQYPNPVILSFGAVQTFNLTTALTPSLAIQFATASASNACTQRLWIEEQLN